MLEFPTKSPLKLPEEWFPPVISSSFTKMIEGITFGWRADAPWIILDPKTRRSLGPGTILVGNLFVQPRIQIRWEQLIDTIFGAKIHKIFFDYFSANLFGWWIANIGVGCQALSWSLPCLKLNWLLLSAYASLLPLCKKNIIVQSSINNQVFLNIYAQFVNNYYLWFQFAKSFMPENISTLHIFLDTFDSKIQMKYFFIVNLEINQCKSVSSIETSCIFRLNCTWLRCDCLDFVFANWKKNIYWVLICSDWHGVWKSQKKSHSTLRAKRELR